jgi:hypothetical protein
MGFCCADTERIRNRDSGLGVRAGSKYSLLLVFSVSLTAARRELTTATGTVKTRESLPSVAGEWCEAS